MRHEPRSPDALRFAAHGKALSDLLVTLGKADYFRRARRSDDVAAWRSAADVTVALLEHLVKETERVVAAEGRLVGYADGMFGYRLAETIGPLFAGCGRWGMSEDTLRSTALARLLRYWMLVCEHDSPDPGRDLNKRIAGSVASVIDRDPRMVAEARRLIGEGHPAIVERLDHIARRADEDRTTR